MWTYDPTLLSDDTAIGRRYVVRLALGDTETADQILQDEEIDWYLSANTDSVYLSTIGALRALIAKYSRLADIWIGHTRVQASQRARQFRELLNIYDNPASTVNFTSTIVIGGFSISENQDLDDDTDAVQPSFALGQDDMQGFPAGRTGFDDGV